MFADKFAAYQKRYDDLHKMMEDPTVSTNPTRLREITREVSEIEPKVEKYREFLTTTDALERTLEMTRDDSDMEMRAMAQEEAEQLKQQQERLLSEMRVMLLPRDLRDDKDIYVEIRGGTGGEEAALFAADLYRMYTRYAERQGWKVALVDENRTGLKGFKEVVFEVKGKGAFSRLKYESGVHRVQRVPLTESSGRIHTSTATVAVMAEVDDIEVEVRPEDLKIDIYHASGHGGQNVQKVATAVRITHLPTGIIAAVQDERSQLQNKLRAMSVLKARLYEMELEKQQKEIMESRRSQVGSGERSEKIRTYNFPQDRVTDHRINESFHNLPGVLDGAIDEIIDALVLADQEAKLRAAGVEV